jgi:hypothetical protein
MGGLNLTKVLTLVLFLAQSLFGQLIVRPQLDELALVGQHLSLSDTPIRDNHATNKRYVDDFVCSSALTFTYLTDLIPEAPETTSWDCVYLQGQFSFYTGRQPPVDRLVAPYFAPLPKAKYVTNLAFGSMQSFSTVEFPLLEVTQSCFLSANAASALPAPTVLLPNLKYVQALLVLNRLGAVSVPRLTKVPTLEVKNCGLASFPVLANVESSLMVEVSNVAMPTLNSSLWVSVENPLAPAISLSLPALKFANGVTINSGVYDTLNFSAWRSQVTTVDPSGNVFIYFHGPIIIDTLDLSGLSTSQQYPGIHCSTLFGGETTVNITRVIRPPDGQKIRVDRCNFGSMMGLCIISGIQGVFQEFAGDPCP